MFICVCVCVCVCGDILQEMQSQYVLSDDGDVLSSMVSSCVPDASHVREKCHPEMHQSQLLLLYDTVTLHFTRSFFFFIIPSIFHVIRVHRIKLCACSCEYVTVLLDCVFR